MSKKGKTLPASQREALDAVLKLQKLNMVPKGFWMALEMGRVKYPSDAPMECDATVRWELGGNSPYIRILYMELRADIKDASCPDRGQRLWYVESLKIATVFSPSPEVLILHSNKLKTEFEISGRGSIDYLLGCTEGEGM